MYFVNIIDDILPEATDEEAMEYANGICERITHSSEIAYHRHVGTTNGIDVYYDFGGDYHFFVEAA